MLPSSIAIEPKSPGRPVRVLVIGRVSTEHQNIENIDASYRYVEDYLRRLYQGPMEIRHLGERASGMLVDRATIREAEDLIATGEWDLVIAEDLSRIFRNPRHQYNFVQDAVDADTRLICIADNLDTRDENWEISLGAAALRHGTTIPDVRRRVRRTATHAFHNGGMVLRVKYGYRKLSREEAASGLHGPKGLRIARRPECTPIIKEMADRVLRGEHYAAIADWLRDERIEAPPYAARWTAKLVRSLLADPILSGTRSFRKVIHRPIYRSGKHRRLRNPEPETVHCPELAHLTVEEYGRLLAAIQQRERSYPQKRGPSHPLFNRPRSRAVWPGQHARCAICGGVMHQIGRHLKCANASGKGSADCWNHVQVACDLARSKIVAWLLATFEPVPSFRETLIEAARQEWDRLDARSDESLLTIQAEIARLERQEANLAQAIAVGGQLQPLLDRLGAVNSEMGCLRAKVLAHSGRAEVDRRRPARSNVDANLESLLETVAASSFEFADLLREILPEFAVRPVQALDTPFIRPRAQFSLRAELLAGFASGGATEAASSLHPITIDLFDPPLHVQHLAACLQFKRDDPRRTLHEIGAELSVSGMTVKRSLHYARLMERQGLTEPYRELRERPGRASRWR